MDTNVREIIAHEPHTEHHDARSRERRLFVMLRSVRLAVDRTNMISRTFGALST